MKFDDQLIAEFQDFDHLKFTVSFMPPKVFLCGGEVDIKAAIPLSARQRLIEYFSNHEHDLEKGIIQAEDFKDYFKEGAYSDLLEFEKDIASIATLIIVCLESPGSLVELGVFCMDPTTVGKLLIIAPQEELEAENSFIYLGPLQNLKRKEPDSVLAYPWPDSKLSKYEHIDLIVSDVKRKLEKMLKTQRFSTENPAHIALLIYDIVILTHPITVTEIELALAAFKIDVEGKTVTRLLYLLEKICLVAHTTYSNVRYYFDIPGGTRRIKFGLDAKGKTRDTMSITLAFKKTYVQSEDEQARKRYLALKHIMKIKAEMK